MEDKWKIIFFETPRGEKIVKEFIKSLDEKTIPKIGREIDLLKKTQKTPSPEIDTADKRFRGLK